MKIKLNFFLVVFNLLIVSNSYFGQDVYTQKNQQLIDSLNVVILDQNSNDSAIVSSYLDLTQLLYSSDLDTIIPLSLKAIKIAEKALEKDSYTEEEVLSFQRMIGSSLNNIGYKYNKEGNLEKAVEYYFKALKIQEKTGDIKSIAGCYNNIGSIYVYQGDFDNALLNYSKSLNLYKESKDQKSIATSLINIGHVYNNNSKPDSALIYYINALDISKANNFADIKLLCYLKLGSLYNSIGQLDTAEDYSLKGLKLAEEQISLSNIGWASLSLGSIYSKQGKLSKATFYLSKAYTQGENIGNTNLLLNSSNKLYTNYKKIGNDKLALKNHELAIKYRDSLDNKKNKNALIQAQVNHEYEIKKALDSLKNIAIVKANDLVNDKELAIEKAKQEKQYFILLFICLILVVTGLFLFIIYRKLKISKAQKKIILKQKERVEHQKSLIFNQQKATESQKLIIEEQHKEISDSIRYAESLQQSVLPSVGIQSINEKSFVLYRPKDKVSGDFFWLEEKGNLQFFIVADCTGHGVPGAFISMIGTILLNEIYNSKEITEPNEILDELRKLIKLTLTNSKGETINDGMDMVIAVLNKSTNLLSFSGANNPVWVISEEKEKKVNGKRYLPNLEVENKCLFELKGDKMPIGGYDYSDPYQKHTIQLINGDNFFLFTDGYADQFGGPKGKKFMYKPFKKLLISSYEMSFLEKKSFLLEEHLKWKGNLDQVDDICIIGIGV